MKAFKMGDVVNFDGVTGRVADVSSSPHCAYGKRKIGAREIDIHVVDAEFAHEGTKISLLFDESGRSLTDPFTDHKLQHGEGNITEFKDYRNVNSKFLPGGKK